MKETLIYEIAIKQLVVSVGSDLVQQSLRKQMLITTIKSSSEVNKLEL